MLRLRGLSKENTILEPIGVELLSVRRVVEAKLGVVEYGSCRCYVKCPATAWTTRWRLPLGTVTPVRTKDRVDTDITAARSISIVAVSKDARTVWVCEVLCDWRGRQNRDVIA